MKIFHLNSTNIVKKKGNSCKRITKSITNHPCRDRYLFTITKTTGNVIQFSEIIVFLIECIIKSANKTLFLNPLNLFKTSSNKLKKKNYQLNYHIVTYIIPRQLYYSLSQTSTSQMSESISLQ